VIMRQ